ncbi:neuropeptide SIFamide receptor, partial [Aplysia californica]|uniref:Neuropeptide SIFamide receptor n=1 Tax=Aplysia californica TaxID=6500 RepID=A0ABM0ZYX6_APLCA
MWDNASTLSPHAVSLALASLYTQSPSSDANIVIASTAAAALSGGAYNISGASGSGVYSQGGALSGGSTDNMTLGEGSNTGTIFMVPSDNGTGLNMSGNFTYPEPFTTPMATLVWVTLANILVFVAGVLGNVLVIVVVLCVREMKTATNLCLMNLSVADLLVLLICQPSALLEFFCQEKWLIGEAMC